jgi:hypothetical protein
MLNLVFNYNDSSAGNGRFLDYAAGQPLLLTSKAWLQSALATPDPNSATDWTFVEHDNQHLLFPFSTQPVLWVRIVDSNQPADDFLARVTVLMGRNDQKHAPQPMSSPIQNANGIAGPLCIWDTLTPDGGSFVRATPGDGTASWIMPLGQATLGSGANGTQNNYIFLVAATVLGNPARTFSHDPDMDISL